MQNKNRKDARMIDYVDRIVPVRPISDKENDALHRMAREMAQLLKDQKTTFLICVDSIDVSRFKDATVRKR